MHSVMDDTHNGHGHAGHAHGSNESRIFWALLLTAGFMLAEVAGGVISGSLALLADAAHMLIDSVSLFFAWLAFRLSHRPADRARTYGYHRFPVLAAFANGIGLAFICIWIFSEAVDRLLNPAEVLAGPMLAVAVLGLAVNIAAFAVLHGADRSNLNVRGALLHVWGDMLGSLAAIGAGLVIMTIGWMPIDPILSILVGLLVLRSAWFLVRDAAHVLLEGVPAQLDVHDIGRDLVSHVAVVEDVHHVHAWVAFAGARAAHAPRPCRGGDPPGFGRRRDPGAPRGPLRNPPCHRADRAGGMLRRGRQRPRLSKDFPNVLTPSMRVAMKSASAVTTMEGPDGVSQVADA